MVSSVVVETASVDENGMYFFTKLNKDDVVNFEYLIKDTLQYRFTYDGVNLPSPAPISVTKTLTSSDVAQLDSVLVVEPFTIEYITEYGDAPNTFKSFEGESVSLETSINNLTEATFGGWAMEKNQPSSIINNFNAVTISQADKGKEKIQLFAYYSSFRVIIGHGANGSAFEQNTRVKEIFVTNGEKLIVDGAGSPWYIVSYIENKTTNEKIDFIETNNELQSQVHTFLNINKPTTVNVDFLGKKVKINFDSNGGSQIISATGRYNTMFDLKEYNPPGSIAPTKNENVFSGWNKQDDSSILGQSFILPDTDINLVANWKQNEYTISFNINGGMEVTKPSDIVLKYNSLADISVYQPKAVSSAKKVGYVFNGWKLTDGTFAQDSFNMPNKNIMLKADWISIVDSIKIEQGKFVTIYKNEFSKEEVEAQIKVTSNIATQYGENVETTILLEWNPDLINHGGIHTIKLYFIDKNNNEKIYSNNEIKLYVLNRPYISAKETVHFTQDQPTTIDGAEWSPIGVQEMPDYSAQKIIRLNFKVNYNRLNFTTRETGNHTVEFSASLLDALGKNFNMLKPAKAVVVPKFVDVEQEEKQASNNATTSFGRRLQKDFIYQRKVIYGTLIS